MYEYAPQFIKKKEKLLTYGFLGLGVLLFAVSVIPGMPLPWVFQLFAVSALVPTVSIFSLCLARRYVYTVEERAGAAPDFTITEYAGKRVQVVCRVSLTSIRSVTPWTGATKATLGEEKQGKQYFSYTGVLFDEGQYLVYAEECGVPLLIRICADDALLDLLGGLRST